MTAHLVISPHPDDAPLTMGATIHHLTARGERVLIATVMSGAIPGVLPDTPVIREFHGNWDVGDDPIDLRRDEDRAAAGVLGAEIAFLDVVDCIYRTRDGEAFYRTREDVFGTVHPDDSARPLPDSLAALAADADVIYVPLSIGRHIDHQIARGWAAQLAQAHPEKKILYYTDYPYAELSGAIGETLARLPHFAPVPVTALTEADLRAKIDAVACYASQISSFWASLDDMAARLRTYFTSDGAHPPHEIFWEYRG